MLGGFAVIEQSAFALIKRLSAAPALKPLPPFPGLPVQDDISAADFAVFLTLWIGADHQQCQGRLPTEDKTKFPCLCPSDSALTPLIRKASTLNMEMRHAAFLVSIVERVDYESQ